MPWADWEFWLVTVLALGGLWLLARPFLPSRKSTAEDAGCPNCTSSSGTSKPKRRRVALTVERRKV
jgi:hypothetical protein